MAAVIAGARLKSGPTKAGSYPAILYAGGVCVKELSVFVDESGDFGAYESHSPYYIVTLVFHNQSVDITRNINHLNEKIRLSGLPETPVHAGPLIRREYEYENLTLLERKRIFNFLYNFTRTTDITYKPLIVEKRQLVEEIDLNIRLTKQFSSFFKENIEQFLQYDRIVVYYDYGQRELTHVIVSLFSALLNNVQFKRVTPANYKLFQAADMLCTLELLAVKAERKMLSKSEILFFSSERSLFKSYLRAIYRKRFE
jgi:hypothetical protein